MKRISLGLLTYLFFVNCICGQDEAALISTLEQIQTQIMEVQGKSDTYTQEFTWDEQAPYKIKLVQTITSKKGKEKELVYEFSLKDIDKNTIKVKNSKDLMNVPVFMDDRQKLVKVFKDGEQQRYTDKLEIAATDIDNARSLETLLETAVPLASKIEWPGLPQSFEERINWLKQNIVPLEIGGASYSQSIEQDADLIMVLHYTLSKDEKKDGEESWHLNLGDLKERAVQMKVKGKEVLVEMQTTRRLKFIQLDKEGKDKSFTNKVAFLAEEPEQAKMIAEVLKALIKESQVLEKDRFPAIADLQSGLELLSDQVQASNLDVKGKTYTQHLESKCVTTLAQDINDSKGNTTENRYLFNLADFNENKLEVDVNAKGVFIKLETGKNKLIQSFEDGEIQNYSNKISLPAKDVENAKWLLHTFPTTIKYCQDVKEDNQFSIKGDWVDWIQQTISESKSIRQTLEKVEDAPCKLQFVTTKEGKKEDTEETYEFNLYDLNPKAIDFKISGKTLAIQMVTRHKEKNIKYYKNGEPGDYKNSFLIEMDNIEKARRIMKTWKQEIEGCKE